MEATFTTAGRINFEDLTLSFKYPNFWEYGELHSDQVDATVRIIRPGNNPVRAGKRAAAERNDDSTRRPRRLSDMRRAILAFAVECLKMTFFSGISLVADR